jgi:hypothetical protein
VARYLVGWGQSGVSQRLLHRMNGEKRFQALALPGTYKYSHPPSRNIFRYFHGFGSFLTGNRFEAQDLHGLSVEIRELLVHNVFSQRGFRWRDRYPRPL